MNQIDFTNPLQRFRLQQVQALLSMSKTTLYDRIRQGKFPPAKKDGRMSYWTVEDIISYQETISG